MPGLFRRPPQPQQRRSSLVPAPTGATYPRTVSDALERYRNMVIADGAIAYWRLGEPSGTNANDEVGSIPRPSE
jgi:hypothetical protein